MNADDFIEEFLSHRAEYDPVKAREYYLRTRELKGRKPGSPQVNPKSKIAYNGEPLKPLGQQILEDETPELSPSGAKLVSFGSSKATLGKAVYADGSSYTGRSGWSSPKAKAAKSKPSGGDRKRRIGAAEQKLIRAKSNAAKIKDPAKKQKILQRISATELKLKKLQVSQRRGVTE